MISHTEYVMFQHPKKGFLINYVFHIKCKLCKLKEGHYKIGYSWNCSSLLTHLLIIAKLLSVVSSSFRIKLNFTRQLQFDLKGCA